MIPQSGIGGEKSKLAQARLQEVCCFSAPFALRLHPSSSLSVPIWEIRGSYFPSNRAALMGCSELFLRFLLKLEREKSAGLRQLSLQHAYGGEM
jgi:hypothetical protein